jgi:hypothetical protein
MLWRAAAFAFVVLLCGACDSAKTKTAGSTPAAKVPAAKAADGTEPLRSNQKAD